MTTGSLFAGIGGLDLGFERAGFDVVWQCEKDDYCTKILNKHWPDTPVYDDVQTLYTEDGPQPRKPDVLIGGFPCQNISYAGRGEGLTGDRSGLWWEFARTIGVVEPRYIVVENVPALTRRGLDAILAWFAENGYDAEWQIVSAAAMGAPHIRERLFVVAYPSVGRQRSPKRGVPERKSDAPRKSESDADTPTVQRQTEQRDEPNRDVSSNEKVAYAHGKRREEQHASSEPKGAEQRAGGDDSADMADTTTERCGQGAGLRPVFKDCVGRGRPYNRSLQRGRDQWQSEPRVGRLDDGVPYRVDRLRGLGNAVVPQVARFVAECVRDHSERMCERTEYQTSN